MHDTKTITVRGYDRYEIDEQKDIAITDSVENFRTIAHGITQALNSEPKNTYTNPVGYDDMFSLDDTTQVTIIKTIWRSGHTASVMIEFTDQDGESTWNFSVELPEANRLIGIINAL